MLQRLTARKDGLGKSNIRATLLTHPAVRVGKLIYAKGPTSKYLIGRTVPRSRSLPKNDSLFRVLQRLSARLETMQRERAKIPPVTMELAFGAMIFHTVVAAEKSKG
jgi:hypothetical protein